MWRRNHPPQANGSTSSEPKSDVEAVPPPHQAVEREGTHHTFLPSHTNNHGKPFTKGIKPEGESYRRGVHPLKFLQITWRSTSFASRCVNVLWPVVPAAIAVNYALPNNHLLIFILNYIAMVPTANLVGFAGQELARKLGKVFGVLVETLLGGVVEVILFAVLIQRSANPVGDPNGEAPAPEGAEAAESSSEGGSEAQNLIPVIQAAILGSILANLLLCLGMCFFVGGLRREEQKFAEAVSEVGSGLLLVAAVGLLVPSAFSNALGNRVEALELRGQVLNISRITAIFLLIAYFMYIWFQMRTHNGIYDAILEEDEKRDHDREDDLKKAKLTLTECVVALVVAITCVSLHAIYLVGQIEFIVEGYGIRDAFMGLILVPIVEKASEHLTAVDEAWDNQMNFALAHILGATIQTALFNAPLVVLIGWGMHKDMNLNFEIFQIVMVVLSIIVVGNFLRDGKSNYLEGALCTIVYLIIAITTFFYPDPVPTGGGSG
ncbi:MAG: hypothetical protein M4579_003909 [Chaenotheca gracillima]|nr:MAG: hypothetical protein M4579_003909 [Chaenotheca gracillima]